MPELPEVETVRRGLAAVLLGGRITAVQVKRHDLRLEIPAHFGQMITGSRIMSLERRAKFIYWGLDNHHGIILHLGMSGTVILRQPGAAARTDAESKHDHVIWQIAAPDSAGLREVIFNDPRRFGLVQLAEGEAWQDHPLLSRLGLEPLGEGFTVAALSQLLRDKRTAIKQLLLDQRWVVGIGNIYVAESLYRGRISPLRPANSLSDREVSQLHEAITSVLREAIAAGGSSLRNFVQSSGELGYFQHHWAVYGRGGQACPDCDCGGTVQQFVQNGRSSYWCPARQV